MSIQAIDLTKTFIREFERKDGSSLSIHQCEIGDVGCVVWDAAIVLSSYLQTEDFTPEILSGASTIELGAGTGIVGLQAASLGADVVVTDLQEFVPLMQKNIECNSHLMKGKIRAESLKWGCDIQEFLPPPDLILMADCIYYEESLDPLVQTMKALCGPQTVIYCCYEERLTDAKIELERKFHQLINECFCVEKIPLEKQDPVFRSEDIHILKLMLNKSSE